MPEEKRQPDVRTELEEMVAREVGDAESERDSVSMTLAKGIVGALNTLLPLEKAEKAPTKAAGAKPDQDVEEEAEGDEDIGDEGEELSDKPEQMNLGDDFDDLDIDDPAEYIDATEWLAGIQAENRTMRKALATLTNEVRALRKEVRAQDTSMREDMGGVLGQLAKGVIGTHEILRDTPVAPVMSPNLDAKLRLIGGSMEEHAGKVELTEQHLVKAMASGIIDDMDLRFFRHNGKFLEDEKQNSALLDEIRKLSA